MVKYNTRNSKIGWAIVALLIAGLLFAGVVAMLIKINQNAPEKSNQDSDVSVSDTETKREKLAAQFNKLIEDKDADIYILMNDDLEPGSDILVKINNQNQKLFVAERAYSSAGDDFGGGSLYETEVFFD